MHRVDLTKGIDFTKDEGAGAEFVGNASEFAIQVNPARKQIMFTHFGEKAIVLSTDEARQVAQDILTAVEMIDPKESNNDSPRVPGSNQVRLPYRPDNPST